MTFELPPHPTLWPMSPWGLLMTGFWYIDIYIYRGCLLHAFSSGSNGIFTSCIWILMHVITTLGASTSQNLQAWAHFSSHRALGFFRLKANAHHLCVLDMELMLCCHRFWSNVNLVACRCSRKTKNTMRVLPILMATHAVIKDINGPNASQCIKYIGCHTFLAGALPRSYTTAWPRVLLRLITSWSSISSCTKQKKTTWCKKTVVQTFRHFFWNKSEVRSVTKQWFRLHNWCDAHLLPASWEITVQDVLTTRNKHGMRLGDSADEI